MSCISSKSGRDPVTGKLHEYCWSPQTRRWVEVQPREDRYDQGEPLESALAKADLNQKPTDSENSAAQNHPRDFARLCLAGNERACFVIDKYVRRADWLNLWPVSERKSLASYFSKLCQAQKPGTSIYCEDALTLDFYNYIYEGPKDAGHPVNCMSDRKQMDTTKTCTFVGNAPTPSGGCTYSTQAVGIVMENQCNFAVEFRVRGRSTITRLIPGGTHEIGPSEGLQWIIRSPKK